MVAGGMRVACALALAALAASTPLGCSSSPAGDSNTSSDGGSSGGGGTRGLVCRRNAGDDAASLTGAWTGTWSALGATGSMTLALTESGSSFSGTATYGGSPCLSSAQLAGTRSGSRLTGTLTGAGANQTFEATFDAATASMEGTFEGTAGACGALSGTFRTTKPRVDGCTCTWEETATPSMHEPCYASREPSSASPNVCCTNGKPIGEGYACSCGAPHVGAWRCFRFTSGTCECRGADDPPPADSSPIEASQCVKVVDGRCGYDANRDECSCFPSGLGLAGHYSEVDGCQDRPSFVTPRSCPPGTFPPPPSTPSACDGDCHGETCFGAAADECDITGCSKRQHVCSGTNQCITIPRY